METKPLLFEQSQNMTAPPEHLEQTLADNFTDGYFHTKIIFFAVAHPELNPIEHCEENCSVPELFPKSE